MSDFDKEAEREKLREKYGDESDERAATRQMSELLLKGATMTNRHCDTCGDPVFRYDGQEFCPTCKQRAEASDRASTSDGAATADTQTHDERATGGGASSASSSAARADAERASGGRSVEGETPGAGRGASSPGKSEPAVRQPGNEQVSVVESVPEHTERNWPVATDVSDEYVANASGTRKPTTGEGAATWFVWNGAGSWKEFAVEPGEPVYLEATTDSALLTDTRFVLQERQDGVWATAYEHDDRLGQDAERVLRFTPETDRIRVVNQGRRGFYVNIHQTETSREEVQSPAGTGEPSPSTSTLPAGDDQNTTDDLRAGRQSLERSLARFAQAAAESDDPQAAQEHLAAAREAAEALSALRQ